MNISINVPAERDGTAPSVFRCFRTDWICKTPRQCQNASRDRYRFPLIVGKRSRWCFAVAKLVPKSRLFFSSSNMISKVAVKNMGLVSSGRRKSGHAARRIAPATNGISKSSGEVDTGEPNSQSRQSFNMTEVIRSDNRVTKSRWAFWSSKFRYYRKGHDNDHRVKFLTKSQRQNVVRSWEKVPNKRALGEEIYIQIFMHKPMLKSLFPFRTVPVDQLRNNALFTRQAAIFADFIDCVVGYLAINNGNLIMELSERVGVNHALMTSVNFDPEWWVLFANSVLDCIRQYCEPKFICLPISRHITRKIMIAWRILLKEVVDRMSEAFIQRRELDIRQENNCDPNAQLVESAVKQNHSEDDDLNNPNLEIFDVQL
ncbi:hypothetical protein T09_11335 [Trichinella sp. T9]|nr:hypothetical protein T09_11335 [Trichinella sp. T9]